MIGDCVKKKGLQAEVPSSLIVVIIPALKKPNHFVDMSIIIVLRLFELEYHFFH